MAEIVGAAASVISVVLSLSKDLYKEFKLREGVKGDIEKLKDELRHMKAYLKDADSWLEMNNSFRELVSDVRRLAYAAENTIDTFSLTSGPETTHAAGSSCIPCCSSTSTFRPINHTLGSQLENLLKEAENIKSKYAQYANVTTESDHRRKSLENLRTQRVEISHAPRTHEHMVGQEDTIDFLEKKLTSGGSDHHFVMSIIGMGGLGKTTLARSLYNKLSGRSHFKARGWICVSQEYDPKDLLLQLIEEIIKPEKKVLKDLTTKHSREAYLCNYLKKRCFLVVIDDVWDIGAWERIHGAFPQNNLKSRIIITTRNNDVAQIDGAYVHELRGLNEEESWVLFCRKSFPRGDVMTKCSANMETLGKEMVKKCDGLPLALVTLGGLLSRKSTEISEWKAVSDNLLDQLDKGSPFIDAVLTLSYRDLSYNLKQCFLYIGMFPEDFSIPISKLMLLWEAEGLIAQEKGRPEDISKTYFKELVGRSLLQEVGRNSWSPHEFCRIHDLLRDLAIRKAKEIDFSAFYYARQRFSLGNEARPHIRLAMSYLHPSTIPPDYTNDCLRTFCLRVGISKVGQSSDSSYISVDKLLQSIDRRFNLLRVLDIEVQGSITNLQLGKMILLKYLGINCIIQGASVKLPETIGDLQALQTISIKTVGKAVTLPKTMVKLQNLKHIIGCEFHFEGDWIGKLRSLEALEFINSNKWCEIDASNLVNLRRLKLRSWEEVNATRFYLNFRGLTKLHTLLLFGITDYPPDFISNIFINCPSITHFTSVKYDPNNGDMLEFAKNLIHLDVRLIDDIRMIAPTERFAELRFLSLTVIRNKGPMMVMTCSEVGFPQLQTLFIRFEMIKGTDADLKLEVAEGGMPLLTTLQVNGREHLIVPERLEKFIIVASW